MDGGDLPGFYPTRVIFFCIAGGMALADVFDARFGVVPFSAPRLRLVTELKLFCRFTAISPCSGNLFFVQQARRSATRFFVEPLPRLRRLSRGYRRTRAWRHLVRWFPGTGGT